MSKFEILNLARRQAFADWQCAYAMAQSSPCKEYDLYLSECSRRLEVLADLCANCSCIED